ncbi:hypothetical protein V6Z12_A04G065900 [Gossypium hirsutum]
MASLTRKVEAMVLRIVQEITPRKTEECCEIFKQVKINISLLNVIKQVSSYAKFLKDMCIVKRKHNVQNKTFLTKHASSIIQHVTPPKYKDLSFPTISCITGNSIIERVVLDLGASLGIVKYVLVQIDKFYFLVDFIVLDTHPVSNSIVQIPVILGHPFLATSNALVIAGTN